MPTDKWYCVTVSLATLAFVLMVVGVATPLWVWLDGEEEVGVGLFYRIGWEFTGTNIIPADFLGVKFLKDDTNNEDHWKAMSVLVVASCVFAGVLLCCLIFQCWYRKESATMYRILLFTSIFGWLFCAVGLIVFVIYHGDSLTTARDISSTSFSWSFVCCLVGGMITVLITAIIVTKFKRQNFNALPAAADPKISLYPATRTGLGKHVFQGMPYSTGSVAVMDMKPASVQGPQPLAIMPAEVVDNHGDRVRPVERNLEIESPRIARRVENIRAPPPAPLPAPVPVNADRFRPVVRDLSNWQTISEPRQESRMPLSDDVIYRGQEELQAAARSQYTSHTTPAPTITNGFRDNQAFIYSPTGDRPNRLTRTTVLDRRDQDIFGDNVEEETVFNRLDRGINPRPGIDRGDFMVGARHNAERDVYRQPNRYLSHTLSPDEARDQGLVLSPSNLTETNVNEYNPSMVYRPYSEQVY